MPRRNRVDPWGDMHAVSERGLFTGNRGCLVDDDRRLARHHHGSLWIICQLEFRGWRHALDAPRTWTPLFFLDDAVALAAGHRPCGLCRRDDYLAYRAGVTTANGGGRPVLAPELNRRLASDRLGRGRGLDRGGDRRLWSAQPASLPVGTVVVHPAIRTPHLVSEAGWREFSFAGWRHPTAPVGREVEVLTTKTTVAAMRHGYTPTLHPSALA